MSGCAAPLPSFSNDSPHVLADDVDLQVGEAGGIGCAVPLPPKSCPSHDMTCSFAEVILFIQSLDYFSSQSQAARVLECCLT